MNNYHLYEEIGHGKFSMVYKGRKRRTIGYVAVKSVEKARRDKVMIEVRVLSQMSSANIVGFVNWYETRNHLWIIFEYCAGGDLRHLIKQDGRLPEEQVRRFSRDICSGLLHVHSKSVVYSDLKPSNVLFNEEGVCKLCDFGYSQLLNDIARAIEENIALPRRGTPTYMAPELFQDGGIHSFASDLWAVGCVLYELYAGRAPFHSTSFPQLQQLVLREPTPQAGPIATASVDAQQLLAQLLQKNPLVRIEWPQLRSHSFWHGRTVGDDADACNIPLQPHLEELRRVWQAAAGDASSAVAPKALAASPPARSSTSEEADSDPGSAVPRRGLRMTETPDVWRNMPLEERHDSRDLDDGQNGGGYGKAPPSASAKTAAALQAALAGSSRPQSACSASPTAAMPLGLRARLGGSLYSRVRELASVGEKVVRPISRNPQIEEQENLDIRLDLPFQPLSLEEICSRSHTDLEPFLAKVYKCIAQGSQDQKMSAITYLQQICGHMQVADILVNSMLLRLLLRMLHACRVAAAGGQGSLGSAQPAVASAAVSPQLQVRILSLIGQTLQSTTYVEPSIGELGLFDVLLDALRHNEPLVKRRSAAALGELLFYIATQPPGNMQEGSKEPGGASSPTQSWSVPEDALQALGFILAAPDGDEATQHYVAKTIENIATQCPGLAQRWFDTPEVLGGLASQVQRSSYEPFRLSCLACLAHLCRSRPDGTGSSAPSSAVRPSWIVAGLQELAPAGLHHGLQLMATVLLNASDIDVARRALPPDIVSAIMAILCQTRYAGALRARACVLLVLLCVLDDPSESRFLRAAVESSFVQHLDRLGREKDHTVVQCVASSSAAMDVVVSTTLQVVLDILRNMAEERSSPVSSDRAVKVMQVLNLCLYFPSSGTLSGCMFGARVLQLLGAICEVSMRVSPASPNGAATSPVLQVQQVILSILDALASQHALLLEHSPQVVHCLLPPLVACLHNKRADIRLRALQGFSSMCVVLMNDMHVFDPSAEKPAETTVMLEALLIGRALPALPTLLLDEDPALHYALRLAAAMLSRGSAAVTAAMRDLSLEPALLGALRSQQALSLHAALLVHCLLRSRSVTAGDLRDVGVLETVYDVLNDASQAASVHPPQMDFAMVDAALCVAEEVYLQSAEALRHQPNALADAGPLAHALPLLAALCAPLAHAKLGPLLDRATKCCEMLGSLLGVVAGRGTAMTLQAVAAILHALAALGRWQKDSSLLAADAGRLDPASPCALQRRLLGVLTSAAAAGASSEARADIAGGLERLFRERLLSDDAAVKTEARNAIAMSLSQHAGH
eukprot:TRINITY_DN43604_c0_g2_i1.p1 TRINITY_DN43604_c0_g2~~TRINITY_DN43604_c0_g2_i1.p1  ORF type:complete len:1309 (+),score=242.74 TRINITY_DN43604_c0_g2_i1:218-4144(+)